MVADIKTREFREESESRSPTLGAYILHTIRGYFIGNPPIKGFAFWI